MAASMMRSFSAHAAHRADHHIVEGVSFEDAAVAFAERWASDAEADDGLRILVTDRESGEEQCLIVHLGEGEAEPCGA